MAGVKGRSGGARPGAGRPRKKVVEDSLEPQAHGGALKRSNTAPVPQDDQDMLTLLQRIALGQTEASALQVRAAIAAVQYTHIKAGEGGKKEAKDAAAKKAASGRFATRQPPRLVVNNHR